MTKEEVQIVSHMIAVALQSSQGPKPIPDLWINKKALLAIWNDPGAVRTTAPLNEVDWVSFAAGSFNLTQ